MRKSFVNKWANTELSVIRCAELLELLLSYECLDSLPFQLNFHVLINGPRSQMSLSIKEQDNAQLGLFLASSLATL